MNWCHRNWCSFFALNVLERLWNAQSSPLDDSLQAELHSVLASLPLALVRWCHLVTQPFAMLFMFMCAFPCCGMVGWLCGPKISKLCAAHDGPQSSGCIASVSRQFDSLHVSGLHRYSVPSGLVVIYFSKLSCTAMPCMVWNSFNVLQSTSAVVFWPYCLVIGACHVAVFFTSDLLQLFALSFFVFVQLQGWVLATHARFTTSCLQNRASWGTPS